MTSTLTAAPERSAADLADEQRQIEAWGQLNPCVVCEANQHEGPETTARTALHCWNCGYRPGQQVSVETLRAGVSETALAKAMSDLRNNIVADLLKALQSGETVNGVSLTTPAGTEVPVIAGSDIPQPPAAPATVVDATAAASPSPASPAPVAPSAPAYPVTAAPVAGPPAYPVAPAAPAEVTGTEPSEPEPQVPEAGS